MALSRSLEDHIKRRLEAIASKALVTHLEEAMNSNMLESVIQPASEEDIKNMDWSYLYSKGGPYPKTIKIIDDEVHQTIVSLEKNKFTGEAEVKEKTQVSKLSTDVYDIMALAPITDISLKDLDLGTVIIESHDLSIKNTRVGRLYAHVHGSGKIINFEAEDVVWTSEGVGTQLEISNMKANKVSISLSGTGSKLTIDGLEARSANIQLSGTGASTHILGTKVNDLKYANTGTGSFTQIEHSSFKNMQLFNAGTGGATYIFDSTANNALIYSISTGADIFMDNLQGEGILVAHSNGSGGGLVGHELNYPIIQVSNHSTSSLVFLNKIRSDLLITCNGYNDFSFSTSKEFFFEQYERRLKYLKYREGSYDNVARDRLSGYNRIRSKMHDPGFYTTDIGELDTQVLIILDSVFDGEVPRKPEVRAYGKADLLIAPEGLFVEGLEYNQRIDFTFD